MTMARKASTPVILLVLGVCALAVSGCGGAQARLSKHMAKGQAYLAAENYEKARVEFQNALQIAPKNAEARYDMGVVAEKLGNPREAAQFYQGAIDANPDYIDARTKLARLYLFAGVPDRASDLIGPALVKHPDDPSLLTVRAAIRSEQKDAAGALADAERAVQLAPTNEDAISVLAGVYKSQGDTAKSQALLEQSIEKLPGSVDLRLVLAQVYAQEGQTANTEAQLLKIIELKPKDKADRLRLAQFYAQSNQTDAAERTLRQAVKDLPTERDLKISLVTFLAARRSRDVAEAELKAMIQAAPADHELQFALAAFYQDGKEPAKAEAIYRQVIATEKLNAPGLSARDRLAGLRLQANDDKGALALANEVLAASPRDDDALMIRGDIALKNQDPRAAIADLRAVLRDQPNAVGALRSLARAHLANGEPAVAEETMRHAVEANPGNPTLQLDFAELLVQMGKPEQAKSIIAELVRQKPDDVTALDVQFRIAVAGKDWATAKSAADAIVAQRPTMAVGYLYQGIVAEGDKHLDDALRLYSRAAELQPEVAEPLASVVRVLVSQNRLPDAIKRLDEVSEKYPAASFALTLKGEVLGRAGKMADAKSAYQQAILRTPKWWAPYRGLAQLELADKEDQAVVIGTLQKGIAAAERTVELRVQLASLYEQSGKYEDAMREYEDVLRTDPQFEVAANNLAMLLATYHKDPASLDRAKQLSARFANSNNPSYLDTYGWVLFKQGDANASVPVLTQVVAKAPDAPVARYHLGMAQSLAGDDSDARANLSRAVNSGAQFYGLAEARATLDKLGKSSAAAAEPPKS